MDYFHTYTPTMGHHRGAHSGAGAIERDDLVIAVAGPVEAL
jgi:hypothetical protein